MRILQPLEFLDEYLLLAQFYALAGLSKNAYKSWKNVSVARYARTRPIFIQKACILPKYRHLIASCEDLQGFVLASAFCSFTGLSPSHLVKKNGSLLYDIFKLKEFCGVKFLNLKAFYDLLGLDYSYHLYIEKCHFFSPQPLEKRIKITPTMCVGYY